LQFTLPLLKAESNDETNHLLLSIFHKLENTTYPLPTQPSFNASATAISINCLIFASIAGSLIAAFFALSIKQWTRSYSSGLENIVTPQLLARHRQFRIEGVRQWRLGDISRGLPIILHISLALFAIGVAEFLLYTSGIELATVVIVAGGVTAMIHILLSLTPLLFSQSPFQSPLTRAFYGIWSTLQNHYGRFTRQSTHKRDLTDPLDRTLGKETSISRLIHVSKHLDIGVLVSLMEIADRHTEEWVLDLCLLEMIQLRHIPAEKYHLFYHETILETYLYLVSTCIYESNGVCHILPGMESRARAMCRFVIWFGSVYSPVIYDSLLEKSCQIGSSADTRGLTDAFYQYGTGQRSLCDIIHGHLAWVASIHLCDLPKAEECRLCIDSDEDRSAAVLDFLLNYDTDYTDPMKRFEDGRLVIEYIIFQTRCAFHYNNPQYPSSMATQTLRRLVYKYHLYDPMFLEVWELWSFPVLSTTQDPWIGVLQSAFKGMRPHQPPIPVYQANTPLPTVIRPLEGRDEQFGIIQPSFSLGTRRGSSGIKGAKHTLGPYSLYRSRNGTRIYPDRITNSSPVMGLPRDTYPAAIEQSRRSRSSSRHRYGARFWRRIRRSRSPRIKIASSRRSRSYSPRFRSRRGSRSPFQIVIHESRPSSRERRNLRRDRSRSRSRPRSRSPIIIPVHRRSRSRSPVIIAASRRSRSPQPQIIIASPTRPRSRSRSPPRIIIPTQPDPQQPVITVQSERPHSPTPIIVPSHRSRTPSPIVIQFPTQPQSPPIPSLYRRSRSPSPIVVSETRRSRSPHVRRSGRRSRSPGIIEVTSPPRFHSSSRERRSRSHSPPPIIVRADRRQISRSPTRIIEVPHYVAYTPRVYTPEQWGQRRRRATRSRSPIYGASRDEFHEYNASRRHRSVSPPPRRQRYRQREAYLGSIGSARFGRLGEIAISPTSSMQLGTLSTSDHSVHAEVYCDVYIAATQVQSTSIQIRPESSMELTGSSQEGHQTDATTEFSVTTGSADIIETQADPAMTPCLFYAMR
jgi:hypothetical protein